MHIPEYTQGTWTNHEPVGCAAAAQPPRDRQAGEQGPREGLHPDPAVALLQGRSREGRDRGGARQETYDKRHALAAEAGRPREAAGAQSPAQGNGLGGVVREEKHDAPDDATDVTQWWQRPRHPRALRRTRPLPATQRPGQGLRAVRQAGPKIGREWPIRYRGSHEERIAELRAFGVRRFSALPYAHRPGIAGYLNGWARDFAERVPECLWSATFYPEPGVTRYVSDLIEGASRCSSCTPRSGSSGSTTRHSMRRSGGRGRRYTDRDPRGIRSGRQPVHRSAPPRAAAPATPGSPPSSRTWVHRSTPSSSAWSRPTRTPASTRPWSSLSSSTSTRRPR